MEKPRRTIREHALDVALRTAGHLAGYRGFYSLKTQGRSWDQIRDAIRDTGIDPDLVPSVSFLKAHCPDHLRQERPTRPTIRTVIERLARAAGEDASDIVCRMRIGHPSWAAVGKSLARRYGLPSAPVATTLASNWPEFNLPPSVLAARHADVEPIYPARLGQKAQP